MPQSHTSTTSEQPKKTTALGFTPQPQGLATSQAAAETTPLTGFLRALRATKLQLFPARQCNGEQYLLFPSNGVMSSTGGNGSHTRQSAPAGADTTRHFPSQPCLEDFRLPLSNPCSSLNPPLPTKAPGGKRKEATKERGLLSPSAVYKELQLCPDVLLEPMKLRCCCQEERHNQRTGHRPGV